MMTMIALMFAVLFGLMFLGIPVAFSIGTATIAFMTITKLRPISIFAQTLYGGLDSFVRLAVPLFILTGYLMECTGLSKRLINFVECYCGRMPASTGVITIVTCTIFAALTGSGPATVAAIGAIMLPALLKNGYSDGDAAGLVAAGSALGPIIPPSIGMIVYGATMELNIPKMFAAAAIPGLLMAAAMIGVNVYLVKKWGLKGNARTYMAAEKAKRSKDAIGVLLLPVIVLGGIYGGVFTPTEAAAIACMYSLLLGLLYRELTWAKICDTFIRTCETTATVGFILAMSGLFGWILAATKTPAILCSMVISVVSSQSLYILLLILILLVVGCFMETLSSIVILAPIVVPIGIALGLDPLHVGMVFCLNLIIGIVTPPFGVNIFYAVSTTGVPYERVVKGIIPYMLAIIFVILIVSFIPATMLWLPKALF